MKSQISTTLKRLRKSKNISIDEVVQFFIQNNKSVSGKTIYGWESGVSYPKLDNFLLLCELYEIKDVVGIFKSKPKKIG